MDTLTLEMLYEDTTIRVWWDAKAKLLGMEAKCSPPAGQYRTTLEKVLQYIKQKRARKVFFDVSKISKVSDEDLLWTETDWFPRELQAGAKLFAVVLPASLAPHLSLDKMFDRVDPGTTGHVRRFFPDAKSAREWLAKQG